MMEGFKLSLTEATFSPQSTNNQDNCSPIVGKSYLSSSRPIKCHFLLISLVTIVILSALFNVKSQAAIYSTSDREVTKEMLEDYGDNGLVRLFLTKKVSCVRRGAICDMRPSSCCSSAVCKCNLWGTNCRCQRMGLFVRWGRK